MQLGFVSGVFFDLKLEEVLAFATDEGFTCIEAMCFPADAVRGACHIDVTRLDDQNLRRIHDLLRKHKVTISCLGYYPNPLDPDLDQRNYYIDHLKRVISAAPRLDVKMVSTFVGRDPHRTVDENWPVFQEVWPDIVQHAEHEGVTVIFENCPKLSKMDDWPAGRNLACTPAVWQAIFQEIPTLRLGLNFDPSHLLLLQIDVDRAMREFSRRIHHIHVKDARIDKERLYQHGVHGLNWGAYRLPGLGQLNWSEFFATLTDIDYRGALCIEMEDQAFDESLESRKRALRQSKRFLEQYMS